MRLPRVLVIESDPQTRSDLVRELGQLGCTSEVADDAEHAGRLIGAADWHAVLASETMPGLPAYGLLRMLRRDRQSARVVVVGTGRSVDDVIALFRAGAIDYLRAPVRLTELGAVLDHLAEAEPSPSRPSDDSPAPRHDDPVPAADASAGRDRRPETGPRADGTRTGKGPRSAVTRLVEQLRDGTIELPAMAPIARRVQELSQALDTPVEDVVACVGQDPVVAGSLLHLANSAEVRGRNPATNLRAACIRLGNRRVLALAQQVLLQQQFSFGSGRVAQIVEAMWTNAVATAHIAREIAKLLEIPDVDDVYLTALLHNIGELVLLKLLVELGGTDDLPLGGIESVARELAAHHEVVGRLVLQSWDAPTTMWSVAGSHHVAFGRIVSPRRRLGAVTLAAWTVACQAGFRYLPDHRALDSAPHLRRIGLKDSDYDELESSAIAWVEAYQRMDSA